MNYHRAEWSFEQLELCVWRKHTRSPLEWDNVNRRKYLTVAGTACVPLSGGCLANTLGRATRTDTATNDTTDVPSPDLDAHGPARGESDVDLEVRDVEDDETVEYVAEDDAVRYVAAWRQTNPEERTDGEPPDREPIYETTPFERWGETQCLSAAARVAAKHVNDELDTDDVGGGITSAVAGEDRAAFISVRAVLDRNGNVVHVPDVEFEGLVSATPTTVEATYVLDHREYELDAPVYALYRVLQHA